MDDARRAASIHYSEKMYELEKKQEDISQAFDALSQVRMSGAAIAEGQKVTLFNMEYPYSNSY